MFLSIKGPVQRILLADDDEDDCFLFNFALEELPVSYTLNIVHNGEELMQLLNNESIPPPQILFLDLNMPRKNGIQCLSAIKGDERLKQLPVIIFSTSISPAELEQLYMMGADYCIRKPGTVAELKEVIYQVLVLAAQENSSQPSQQNFVLSNEFYKDENKQ